MDNLRIVVQPNLAQMGATGYRPTEGKGSAGALAATKRHLTDMQRLVFEGHK